MARPLEMRRIAAGEVIAVLQKRERWPVAMLADVLGVSGQTIYRYIWEGRLEKDRKGVLTASILRMMGAEP